MSYRDKQEVFLKRIKLLKTIIALIDNPTLERKYLVLLQIELLNYRAFQEVVIKDVNYSVEELAGYKVTVYGSDEIPHSDSLTA